MEFRSSFSLGASSIDQSVNQQDPTWLLEKLGEDYLKQAMEFETKGKTDKAFKFFSEAANKFAYIVKNFDGHVEQVRM